VCVCVCVCVCVLSYYPIFLSISTWDLFWSERCCGQQTVSRERERVRVRVRVRVRETVSGDRGQGVAVGKKGKSRRDGFTPRGVTDRTNRINN
jgi:hypothetical protein